MGLIKRFADFFGSEKRATENFPSVVVRPPGVGFYAGVPAHTAENISAVLACVNAIATALSYVPVIVYRRDGNDKIEAPSHPLSRIVRGGVSDMSWPEFVEHVVASTLLQGNGLAVINRAANGQISDFKFVPWGRVGVVELTSGRIAYDVSDERGKVTRYLQGEVIHLRDRTDDGRVGRSRLSRAADTIDAVKAANTHARTFLNNGAFPAGVLQTDQKLSPEARKNISEGWSARHSGVENAGRTPVLQEGLKWAAITINPEDAELLETRRFGIEEIARLYQVPPPIIGDYTHNTFTNSEMAGIWFATFTLTPWARKIEAEFARNVLASGFEIELDLSGFLRGDPATRWNSNKIAIETGVLDPDEVRQLEGWNSRKQPTADGV